MSTGACGCAGTAGRVPLISTVGNPSVAQLPNANFAVRLSNALPGAPFAFVVSAAPSPVLLPCNLMVGPIALALSGLTTAAGEATLPVPIPTQ